MPAGIDGRSFRSEPQMPHAVTLSTSSPGPGDGSAISVTSRRWESFRTAARMSGLYDRRLAAVSALPVLLDGIGFGEGPRWHDGRLWFSDFHRHAVSSVGDDGER